MNLNEAAAAHAATVNRIRGLDEKIRAVEQRLANPSAPVAKVSEIKAKRSSLISRLFVQGKRESDIVADNGVAALTAELSTAEAEASLDPAIIEAVQAERERLYAERDAARVEAEAAKAALVRAAAEDMVRRRAVAGEKFRESWADLLHAYAEGCAVSKLTFQLTTEARLPQVGTPSPEVMLEFPCRGLLDLEHPGAALPPQWLKTNVHAEIEKAVAELRQRLTALGVKV